MKMMAPGREPAELEFEAANAELLQTIPREELDRVLSSDRCDIDATFLGFVGIYKNLSRIIPRHFTVVDLGCGYNPQSYFFAEHRRFIAVDNFRGTTRFQAPGTEFIESSIHDFIQGRLSGLALAQTFAICSYVPPWGHDNIRLVREAFENVFTYYPSGSPSPFDD